MSFVKLKQLKNAFERQKVKLLEPSRKIQGMFVKQIYPLYQELQFNRWKTEGASEGGDFQFPAASRRWVQRKIRQKAEKPALFPGGEKRLTYTGGLVSSVIGRMSGNQTAARFGRYHRRLITDRKMTIVTTLPYAPRVVDWMAEKGKRSFMEFGRRSQDKMKREMAEFLRKEFSGGR